MNGSLRAQCIAEDFRHRAVSVFGICCLSALKRPAPAAEGCGRSVLSGDWVFLWRCTDRRHFGGHLNPAVCIALWLFACFRAEKWCPYIVAQVAGAFGGAVLLWMLQHPVYAI